MVTKLRALPPSPDADIAASIKRQVETLCKSIEVARLRGIRVDFHIGTGADGKFKVTQLDVTRTEKLLK